MDTLGSAYSKAFLGTGILSVTGTPVGLLHGVTYVGEAGLFEQYLGIPGMCIERYPQKVSATLKADFVDVIGNVDLFTLNSGSFDGSGALAHRAVTFTAFDGLLVVDFPAANIIPSGEIKLTQGGWAAGSITVKAVGTSLPSVSSHFPGDGGSIGGVGGIGTTGGSMVGPIHMGGNDLDGLPSSPLTDSSATAKSWVLGRGYASLEQVEIWVGNQSFLALADLAAHADATGAYVHGLGNASTLNVGTSAGTVAEGNDTRFVPGGATHAHTLGQGAQIDHTACSSIGTNTHAQLDAHLASTSNPHSVTAAQAGAVPTTRTVAGHELSTDVTLTTADIADSADARYCTDAQKTVLGNTSGTNTGDQTLSGLGGVASTLLGAASGVATLDSGGTLATAQVPSDVTRQGSTFNGNSQLVKTTAEGKLPALDGSLLTGIDALPAVGSAGDVLTVVGGAPAWAAPIGGGGGTQTHFPIPLRYPNAGKAGWARTLDTYSPARYAPAWILTADGNDAYLQYNVPLPAGTYDVMLEFVKASNRGIVHIYAGTTELGSVDGYQSGGDTTTDWAHLSGCVLGSDATTVSLRMDTKNASSSGYYGTFTELWLVRTGA